MEANLSPFQKQVLENVTMEPAFPAEIGRKLGKPAIAVLQALETLEKQGLCTHVSKVASVDYENGREVHKPAFSLVAKA